MGWIEGNFDNSSQCMYSVGREEVMDMDGG